MATANQTSSQWQPVWLAMTSPLLRGYGLPLLARQGALIIGQGAHEKLVHTPLVDIENDLGVIGLPRQDRADRRKEIKARLGKHAIADIGQLVFSGEHGEFFAHARTNDGLAAHQPWAWDNLNQR
jgi:hypothetical protein